MQFLASSKKAVIYAEQLGSHTAAIAQTTSTRYLIRSTPQATRNPLLRIPEANSEVGGLSDRLGLAVCHQSCKDPQKIWGLTIGPSWVTFLAESLWTPPSKKGWGLTSKNIKKQ